MSLWVQKYGCIAVAVAGLLAGVVPVAWGEDQNQAEALFKKMEEQLLQAQTLQVTTITTTKGASESYSPYEATIFLQEGDKARLEFNYEPLIPYVPPLIVSDGTSWQGSFPGIPGDLFKLDTPRNLKRILTLAMARGGTNSIVSWLRGSLAASEAGLLVSEFNLGNEEEVNGRSAQAIQYKLATGDDFTTMRGTIWLDAETLLPLKRVFVATQGDDQVTSTETFHDLKLNEKIPPSAFEVPSTD